MTDDRRYFPVSRKIHRIEQSPNLALEGYYHVSENGPYRSTLQAPGKKAEGLGLLSKRQRRKKYKAMRRMYKDEARVQESLHR